MNLQLCTPSIIYLFFSLTQIIIDTYKGLYNTAIIKTMVMIVVTILLNIMCERGLSVISWFIVFIPFILMTVIVSILLYVFGLDVATGKIKYNSKNENINKNNIENVTKDNLGNTIIYDPQYNPVTHPIYYQAPNIIIPNNSTEISVSTNSNSNTYSTSNELSNFYQNNKLSSDPAYQS